MYQGRVQVDNLRSGNTPDFSFHDAISSKAYYLSVPLMLSVGEDKVQWKRKILKPLPILLERLGENFNLLNATGRVTAAEVSGQQNFPGEVRKNGLIGKKVKLP